MEGIFDEFFSASTIFLSLCIILNFIAALFFGLKLLFQKDFEIKKYALILARVIVSFIWMCIFIYIFIMECLGRPVFKCDSFGALYIRPVILLTAVEIAIAQKICWEQYRKTGGYKCQKNIRR